MEIFCRSCVQHGMYTPVEPRRVEAGYTTCLPCGETQARSVRHTIVPMAKSNYIVVSDRELLKCLNKYARV